MLGEIYPSKHIQRLKPYKLSERIPSDGQSEPILKLDWNEATRTPSTAVKNAVLNFLECHDFSAYPDLVNDRLTALLSSYTDLQLSQLQFFSGSDEGLDCLARAFLSPGDIAISLSPNYDNFRIFAEAVGAKYVEKFYDKPFSNNISNLLNTSLSPRLVYISNPNNPTGVLLSQQDLSGIARRFPDALIIVDEAYFEFAGITAASLISRYQNVAISRTFSKAFGLAGIRFGYVLSNPSIINIINRIRNPKSINILAQVAAVAALENKEDMHSYVNEVIGNRQELIDWLIDEKKEVRNSYANFIMVQSDNPFEFVSSMLKNGVIVRDRSSMPLLEGYVRITIGGNDSYGKLRNALRASLGLMRDGG